MEEEVEVEEEVEEGAVLAFLELVRKNNSLELVAIMMVCRKQLSLVQSLKASQDPYFDFSAQYPHHLNHRGRGSSNSRCL